MTTMTRQGRNSSGSSSGNGKGKKSGKFLRCLKRIIDDTPAEVAGWSADGKQYNVLRPKAFERILIQAFPNAHPKTFFRQLSHYKITKLNALNGGGDGKTSGSFSLRHEMLRRDQPDRIFEIECQHRKRYYLKEEGEEDGERQKRSRSKTTTRQQQKEEEEEDEDEGEEDDTEESTPLRVDEYLAIFKLEQQVLAFQRKIFELANAANTIIGDQRFQAMATTCQNPSAHLYSPRFQFHPQWQTMQQQQQPPPPPPQAQPSPLPPHEQPQQL